MPMMNLLLIGRKIIVYILVLTISMFFYSSTSGQILSSTNTQVKIFTSASTNYQKDKLSFGFSETDFIITSDITDRLSFLGETVFRYDDHSVGTRFSVEVERVILKYNYFGNHNIVFGKHHTPINYWNDIYHHGRIFYPTIDRPLLFVNNIIPLHTTGLGLQGHDIGKLKFGYDIMIGNGLGAEEISDNDKYKSITVAAHIKPVENLRIGGSYYYDVISKGALIHQHADDQELHEDRVIDFKVIQHLFSAHLGYFGKKFEFLGEGSIAVNHSDTTCYKRTIGSYVYLGYRITPKITPYVRGDYLNFENGEVFFIKDNTSSVIAGLSYKVNYKAIIKLEYKYLYSEIKGNANKVTAQIAIGF